MAECGVLETLEVAERGDIPVKDPRSKPKEKATITLTQRCMWIRFPRFVEAMGGIFVQEIGGVEFN